MGVDVQPIPRDRGVLTDPRGTVDRTQPSPRGFGSIAEYPGRTRDTSATLPQQHCAALPRILRDNGYVTGGFGKWHLTPDNVAGRGGSVRPLAQGWGLRPLVGLPVRGRRTVRPDHHRRTTACRRARPGTRRQARTTSRRPHRRATQWLHDVRGPGRNKAVADVLLDRRDPRPAPRVQQEWADSTAGSSTTAGMSTAQKTSQRQKEHRHRAAGHRTDRAPRSLPVLGLLSDAQRTLYARQMEVFAGFTENADWNVGRLLDDSRS